MTNEVKLIHLVEEVVYPSKDPRVEGAKAVLSSDAMPWKLGEEALQIAEEHLGQLVGIDCTEVESKDGEVLGIRLTGLLDEVSYQETGFTRPVVYIEEMTKDDYVKLLGELFYLEERELNERLS